MATSDCPVMATLELPVMAISFASTLIFLPSHTRLIFFTGHRNGAGAHVHFKDCFSPGGGNG